MDFSAEEADRLALKPADLLVCEGGDIGRTAFWDGQIPGCLYQNHVHRLRARRPDIHPEFVMYWMQAAFLHLRLYGGVGNRTTIPNLSAARLKQLPIPLPPFQEQKTIAAILVAIQAAVDLQQKIVARLKELKASVMAQLFREGVNGEPSRLAEHGEIPEGWEVRNLGDVAVVSTGTTPATNHTDYYAGSVPFVLTAEINNNAITRTKQAITQEAVDHYGLKVYPAGSILLAMYGQGKTRGRASYLTIAATISQNTAAIEPGDQIDGQFIWHYLMSQYETLRTLGHLGHLSHLNLGHVKSLCVPVPSKSDQVQIRNTLNLHQRHIELHSTRLNILTSLFSGLVPLLMSGQLRVTQFGACDAS